MSSGCYEIFKKKNERKMKKRMKVSILSKGWKLKFLVSCSQFVFFFITISEPTSERKDKRCTTKRTRNWQNRLKRTINHRTSEQPNKPQQLKQKKNKRREQISWGMKQKNKEKLGYHLEAFQTKRYTSWCSHQSNTWGLRYSPSLLHTLEVEGLEGMAWGQS